LQGPLTPAKHHQIVLDELFSKLKRAGGDVYKVLQLSLKSQEEENRELENLKPTCISLSVHVSSKRPKTNKSYQQFISHFLIQSNHKWIE